MSISTTKTAKSKPATATSKPLPKFRALDLTEIAAVASLHSKGLAPFRDVDVMDLRVHYRWQRDGFCLCVVQCRAPILKSRSKVPAPVVVLTWSGVSKRAPVDPHNEIRGRMLAFVRAAQSTPATW